MIDFIKNPSDGGLPVLNCNGHDIANCLIFIARIAQTLSAGTLMVHEVRQDIKPSSLLDVVPSKSLSLDEGKLMQNSVSVAKIVGLPVTPALVRRSRGEDVADDDPQRIAARQKVQSQIDDELEKVRHLQKILEMM